MNGFLKQVSLWIILFIIAVLALTTWQGGKSAKRELLYNDFMEQMASRQDIITNKALIEVVDRIYWDTKMKRPKINATNRKIAGNIRRLLSLVYQLELTYDLRTMSTDDIIKLLPSEFNSWK